ncbi:MAG: DNA-processing protein DprA [Pseudooceanicola sp.]|nr:DNA-processing protein DprA [Pseudooceanicola sp.]
MTEDTSSSTHPPLPPTTEDDRFSWLRLLRSRRVGVTTFYRLLSEHGTAQNALSALPEVARNAGVEDYESCPPCVIEAEMKAARAARARLLCLGDTAYPQELARIADPPPMLWAIGELSLLHRPAVAMVGARNASSLGTRIARALASGLGAAGMVVVSGMARGIDAAAHDGALETGTIAVLAGGVDNIYPAENANLAARIAERGLRLSEQPMGLAPQARHFPVRNRIVSGLSRAVVVVEAAAKSGSLITARDALDQGREVMAVPGHPFDARASGCNMLIRDGAALVRRAEDVLTAIGMPADPSANAPRKRDETSEPGPASDTIRTPSRSHRATVALHQQILDRLGPSPIGEDQLIRDLAATADQVGPALLDLELDGQIARQSGGLLSRLN